jgi:hypothetical protein
VSSANEFIEEAEHFMSEDLTSAGEERRQSWLREASSSVSRQVSSSSSARRQHRAYGQAFGGVRQSVTSEGDASSSVVTAADGNNVDNVLADLQHYSRYAWRYYLDGNYQSLVRCGVPMPLSYSEKNSKHEYFVLFSFVSFLLV